MTSTLSTTSIADEAAEDERWRALVDDYQVHLTSMARRCGLTADEAQDLVQRVWMKVLQHRGQLRDPACLPGWITTVARRECLAMRRERWTHSHADDAGTIAGLVDLTTPLDTVIVAEQHRGLRDAVERLPERERELVRALLDPSEPSYAQISAALHMPVGSIGPIRGRAIERLRRMLDRPEHPAQARHDAHASSRQRR